MNSRIFVFSSHLLHLSFKLMYHRKLVEDRVEQIGSWQVLKRQRLQRDNHDGDDGFGAGGIRLASQ